MIIFMLIHSYRSQVLPNLPFLDDKGIAYSPFLNIKEKVVLSSNIGYQFAKTFFAPPFSFIHIGFKLSCFCFLSVIFFLMSVFAISYSSNHFDLFHTQSLSVSYALNFCTISSVILCCNYHDVFLRLVWSPRKRTLLFCLSGKQVFKEFLFLRAGIIPLSLLLELIFLLVERSVSFAITDS